MAKGIIAVDTPHDQLARKIAESSGYHKFEVEDILLHLTYVLQKEFSQGKSVAIRNFGKFWIQKKVIAPYMCGLRKEWQEESVRNQLRFNPSNETRRVVRGESPDIDHEEEDE